MTRHVPPVPGSICQRRARGITLVELLIATTLMTLVTTGALAAYLHAAAAFHTASVEQHLHERAQYAFATLEPELQMAGYFGAGESPAAQPLAAIPQSALLCGADLLTRLDHALEISADYDLPCAAQGHGPLDGSRMLIIRRVAAQPAAPTPGRMQWLSGTGPAARGELITTGTLPAGLVLTPPRVEVRNLVVHCYYIARASDGDPLTPALRVKTLTSVSGSPAFIDTEVMPGVETLQIEPWPSATAPQSVRITLGLRADAADRRAGQTLRRIAITRHFALRNAAARPS